MKRNQKTNIKRRRKSAAVYLLGGSKSKYAQKKARGNQMYGPGCCGHHLKTRHANESD